ncbi:MAG: thioredoxin [Thermoleophilia bacterium]
MSVDNLVELTDANFESEVLQSDLPVVVDFWAEWCAPCRMVTPVIEELAIEMAGRIKVAKLNVDQNRETATKYDIMSIPTVILFEGGAVSKQVVGALPKESLLRELELE